MPPWARQNGSSKSLQWCVRARVVHSRRAHAPIPQLVRQSTGQPGAGVVGQTRNRQLATRPRLQRRRHATAQVQVVIAAPDAQRPAEDGTRSGLDIAQQPHRADGLLDDSTVGQRHAEEGLDIDPVGVDLAAVEGAADEQVAEHRRNRCCIVDVTVRGGTDAAVANEPQQGAVPLVGLVERIEVLQVELAQVGDHFVVQPVEALGRPPRGQGTAIAVHHVAHLGVAGEHRGHRMWPGTARHLRRCVLVAVLVVGTPRHANSESVAFAVGRELGCTPDHGTQALATQRVSLGGLGQADFAGEHRRQCRAAILVTGPERFLDDDGIGTGPRVQFGRAKQGRALTHGPPPPSRCHCPQRSRRAGASPRESCPRRRRGSRRAGIRAA